VSEEVIPRVVVVGEESRLRALLVAEGFDHSVDRGVKGIAYWRRWDRDAPPRSGASLRERGSPVAPGSPPCTAASPPIGAENTGRSRCSLRRRRSPPLLEDVSGR
jgi:hypothetical protein